MHVNVFEEVLKRLKLLECTEIGTQAISYGMIFTGFYHELDFEFKHISNRLQSYVRVFGTCWTFHWSSILNFWMHSMLSHLSLREWILTIKEA